MSIRPGRVRMPESPPRSPEMISSEFGSLPVGRRIVNDDRHEGRRRGELIIALVNQSRAPSLRGRLRRISRAGLLGVLGTAIVAFGLDFGVFEIRVLAKRNAFGSVTVKHYYAVLQKNGKTTYLFDPPHLETCVNSLFPHAGSAPCWYLSRHPEQRTDI